MYDVIYGRTVRTDFNAINRNADEDLNWKTYAFHFAMFYFASFHINMCFMLKSFVYILCLERYISKR